jgi:hypothetical protein
MYARVLDLGFFFHFSFDLVLIQSNLNLFFCGTTLDLNKIELA